MHRCDHSIKERLLSVVFAKVQARHFSYYSWFGDILQNHIEDEKSYMRFSLAFRLFDYFKCSCYKILRG